MNKRIAAIKEYLEYFPQDRNAKDNLMLCEYSEDLGIELKNKYYPRIEYNRMTINSQIFACKKYILTNRSTNYEFNGNDTLVVWSEGCGRLAFTSSDYWNDIEDEWNWFMSKLMEYEPLDYDKLNNTYIYDVENGKRLINDYNEILRIFGEKLKEKMLKVELDKKKKELERLQKELELASI